ncbi:MAG: hypothetical protein JSR28_19505 [Proteobacteria bacterium]|nr:hypothetical protein [Pseudomonadota bacterium]
MLDAVRTGYGYSASLATGALWLFIAATLALLLPRDLRGREDKDASLRDGGGQSNVRLLGRVGLAALLLFSISANLGFSFTERVGLDNGLDPSGLPVLSRSGAYFHYPVASCRRFSALPADV